MGKLGITVVCVGILALIIAGAAVNHHFFLIVTKGDNIPIIGMLLMLMFVTWLGLSQAIRHDRILEETDGDKQALYDEMCK